MDDEARLGKEDAEVVGMILEEDRRKEDVVDVVDNYLIEFLQMKSIGKDNPFFMLLNRFLDDKGVVDPRLMLKYRYKEINSQKSSGLIDFGVVFSIPPSTRLLKWLCMMESSCANRRCNHPELPSKILIIGELSFLPECSAKFFAKSVFFSEYSLKFWASLTLLSECLLNIWASSTLLFEWCFKFLATPSFPSEWPLDSWQVHRSFQKAHTCRSSSECPFKFLAAHSSSLNVPLFFRQARYHGLAEAVAVVVAGACGVKPPDRAWCTPVSGRQCSAHRPAPCRRVKQPATRSHSLPQGHIACHKGSERHEHVEAEASTAVVNKNGHGHGVPRLQKLPVGLGVGLKMRMQTKANLNVDVAQSPTVPEYPYTFPRVPPSPSCPASNPPAAWAGGAMSIVQTMDANGHLQAHIHDHDTGKDATIGQNDDNTHGDGGGGGMNMNESMESAQKPPRSPLFDAGDPFRREGRGPQMQTQIRAPMSALIKCSFHPGDGVRARQYWPWRRFQSKVHLQYGSWGTFSKQGVVCDNGMGVQPTFDTAEFRAAIAPAIPNIVALLNDSHHFVQVRTVVALVNVSKQAEFCIAIVGVIPDILSLLKDSEPFF
ncbi:hypothetical protein BU17DRAFT_69930 [Hysterangium stoloniferum]|nr:hypothetical protein BU17DRAFT_69930 [Hysterangium stoloniferum]